MTRPRSRFGGIFDKYKIEAERTGGTWAEKYGSKVKHWDIAPDETYFNELARVSKNQIIWGGNYFPLPATRCFLVWRKLTISEGFTMAMCEYAWTSFNENAKWIEIAPQDSKRFHPTQKPVKLYEWLLTNYAKPVDKILDTHLGSGSIAIACHNLGFYLTGYEIDADYYQAACKRLEEHQRQSTLFDPKEFNSVPYTAPSDLFGGK
jgi:site-specific DNA-methyltransferase (adenine-specific)